MSVEWAKVKRTGRWAKRDTWHCSICGAVLEAADAAKVTKHASQHDIEAWCVEADGLLLGQLQDELDE
jgi:hypothetical protein